MRHKLEYEYDFNFLLFGISSNAKDYRLAWAINKNLNLHFKRTDDICTEKEQFGLFIFDDVSNHIQYFLIANKTGGKNLVKALKQIDYLLIVKGNYEYIDEENFLLKLKNSESVLASYKLNAEHLKATQHLLFG